MKYRLTTIERDAAGNVYRVKQPQAARSTLAFTVIAAKEYGYLTRGGHVGATRAATARTLIAVEFTSEETP